MSRSVFFLCNPRNTPGVIPALSVTYLYVNPASVTLGSYSLTASHAQLWRPCQPKQLHLGLCTNDITHRNFPPCSCVDSLLDSVPCVTSDVGRNHVSALPPASRKLFCRTMIPAPPQLMWHGSEWPQPLRLILVFPCSQVRALKGHVNWGWNAILPPSSTVYITHSRRFHTKEAASVDAASGRASLIKHQQENRHSILHAWFKSYLWRAYFFFAHACV